MGGKQVGRAREAGRQGGRKEWREVEGWRESRPFRRWLLAALEGQHGGLVYLAVLPSRASRLKIIPLCMQRVVHVCVHAC